MDPASETTTSKLVFDIYQIYQILLTLMLLSVFHLEVIAAEIQAAVPYS